MVYRRHGDRIGATRMVKFAWKSRPVSTRRPLGWQARLSDGAPRVSRTGTKPCCAGHTPISRGLPRGSKPLGVPVLYLGDLFERPEIRDLLAVMSLTCEPERGGLLRVATFPEYCIPLEDVRAVLGFAAAEGIFPLQAIARIDEISGITDAGRRGLGSLRSHLDFVRPGTSAAVHAVRVSLYAKPVPRHSCSTMTRSPAHASALRSINSCSS